MAAPTKVCELCAGTQFEIICTRDRRKKPLNTVACLGCGLVGHEVMPTDQELTDYYTHAYRKDYHNEVTPSNPRIWRAWLKGERLVRQLTPHLLPGARVFEVGAGMGCNVKAFDLAGFPASGIDLNEGFLRFGRESLKADLRQGTVDAYQPAKPFDLVLFIHTIEHVRSPRQVLQHIHKLLGPTGRLYLECPSLGKQCGDLSELFHFAHLHTFTPIPLLTLARQCGFVVEKCFSNGDGVNHKYLFQKVEPVAVPIDPDGLKQTREYLAKFRQPWHRFGLGYLHGRARRIWIYVNEFLWAGGAVRKLLARTQQQAATAR